MDGLPTKMRLVGALLTLLQGSLSLGVMDEALRGCPEFLNVPMIDRDAREVSNGSMLYGGDSTNVTSGCLCNVAEVKCLRKCCNNGEVLDQEKCVKLTGVNNESFVIPELKISEDNLAPELRSSERLEDHFHLLKGVGSKACTWGSFMLEPEIIPQDNFVLDSEGNLKTAEMELPPERFCVDWRVSLKEVRILICMADNSAGNTTEVTSLEARLYPVGMIVSIPFMVATLFVYAIISDLRNLYGKTLMCYVACLIYAYGALIILQLVEISQAVCDTVAFTIHFSFLASFFWLNVMCFDIWWTFGGFRSLQGSIKQRERKKFLMYSIYAWGCASTLTAVCVIMDFVPGIPETILRPEFGVDRCWFRTEEAKALYFYGPMGITVICNIILFISTAAKIIKHKKDTAHHLKGIDSKRHDDNKQWFNLYLKLFIVMGINWSMEIISWLCQGPKSLWYLTDIANSLQGVIIFIIFVWKQKIKRLLMKRFGCQGKNFLSRDSTRSAYHSSSSRTCTTSVPLHEKTNQFPDPVSRANNKTISDDSDGV